MANNIFILANVMLIMSILAILNEELQNKLNNNQMYFGINTVHKNIARVKNLEGWTVGAHPAQTGLIIV